MTTDTRRTADILYNKMLLTTPKKVARAALRAVNAIQCDKTENQLLGLAAAMVVLLNKYDMEATDTLNMAHNFVYSDYCSNMTEDFKALEQFMRDEWEM